MQGVMRPDFSGVWKLIRGESSFGFLAPPELCVHTVAHEEPNLRIRTRQKDANGDITLDRDLVIGGQAIAVDIRGRGRQLSAAWTNDAELRIETHSVVSNRARRIEDRWTLDDDREWLTIHRLLEQPGGDVTQRLRFQRRG